MTAFTDDIRIEVLTASRSLLGREWRSPGQVDPFCRFYYLNNGAGLVTFREKQLELRPGILYLFPGGERLAYECNDSMDISWMHFRATLKEGVDLFSLFEPVPELETDDPEFVEGLFGRLVKGWQRRTWSTVTEARGITLLLLSRFLDSARDINPRKRELLARLQQVFGYLDRHVAEPLPVPELARRAGMETSHFSVVFRELTGVPPATYVRNRRVELAQRLLLNNSETLDRIASRTGFCDAFHLSRVFKKVTGVSPLKFRQQIRLP